MMSGFLTDVEIVEMLYQRQEQGLQRAKEKYEKSCSRMIQNLLSDLEDVNECLNDVYFTLWQLIPPQKPEKLGAFLLKIARNLALKKYAYDTAKKRNPDVLISLNELAECIPGGIGPETELETARFLSVLNAFLIQQNGRDRKLFLRRFWYFDSLTQIAADFHMTQNAVAVRLNRFRKKLRIYLQKEGFDL